MLAFNLADIIQVPFGYLLDVLYQFTTSYGLALILFAFIVKLILLPATAKGKKSSMKMSRLSPKLKEIQAKYADDQQKQSAAIQELYKKEGVSMGGGCLWSLLPLLILLPLYAVVRQPIQYMLHETAENATKIVDAIKSADPSLFANEFYDQMVAAPQIPNYLEQIKAAGATLGANSVDGINFTFLGVDLAAVPQYNVFSASFWNWKTIGGFLMPVLSAATSLVSMLISTKMNNSLVTNEKGLEDKDAVKESQTAKQGKMMMWFSPIMSLWIGFSMPAAMSVYWFAQGVATILTDVYLTKKYRKIYDAEDAERLKKALEEEAIEAEKERVRAERRAANPDGITANTSKKKLQQAKKQEEEAAKAAAAKEYAVKKGVAAPEEDKPKNTALSGIEARPFCKGRAYDPNRYSNTEDK